MFGDINYWLVSTFVLPVLLGITLHEAAHAWVAWKLGDNTAYDKGRVSFNPFRHIDLFGTIVLPALLVLGHAPFLFGWAKPVPVHFRNLHHPRRDMVLVAAAGPFANLLIALGAGVLLHLVVFVPASGAEWLAQTLKIGIWVNLLLAVFNMLPVPPLDGGRVAVGLLPKGLARPLARLERYGFFILLAVLLGLPALLEALGGSFNPIESIILLAKDTLYNVVLTVTGHI